MSPAQKAWAEFGGLGPVPAEAARLFIYKLDDERLKEAQAEVAQAVARQRHELRLRLIESALPAAVANAHAHRARGSGLVVDGEPANVARWAATSAIGDADAVLDRLAAEAWASAQAAPEAARLDALKARDDAHRFATDLREGALVLCGDGDTLAEAETARLAELLERLRDLLAERGSP